MFSVCVAGLMEHTKRLLRAFFELSQTHRGQSLYPKSQTRKTVLHQWNNPLSPPSESLLLFFFCFVFFPQWRLKPGGAFSWNVTIKWRKMSCFHTMSACWWSCIYYFLFSNFSRSLLVAISERFLVLSLCSIWRCVFCHRGTRAPGCCQRGFCEVCWCSPQHWEIRHSASKDHQTCKHRFNLCFESFIVLKVHTSVKNIHFKESFGKFCLCILYIVFLKSVRVKFIM